MLATPTCRVREGIELPAMVGDAEETVSDREAVIETDDSEEDIQDGTPVQASTRVATDFSARAGMGGLGTDTGWHTRSHITGTHGHGHGSARDVSTQRI
jgi:hypothetical protein